MKITKSWQRGFDAAKAARLYSNGRCPGHRLGAALFNGSNLISIGFNTFGKSHPSVAKKPWQSNNICAEHAALIKRQYFEDTNLIIYVYREDWTGKSVCSRPCNSCMSIMRLANVRRIRFIDENGNFTEERV